MALTWSLFFCSSDVRKEKSNVKSLQKESSGSDSEAMEGKEEEAMVKGDGTRSHCFMFLLYEAYGFEIYG